MDKKDQTAAVAFIGVRLRNLTLDAMGRIVFVEQCDDIFEEVFGVKKFISKIVFAVSRYDIYNAMERIGINVLFDLCNNSIYSIVSDLVGVTVRLDELNKEFKKCNRKGKKINQRDEKEFKYLHKMYKETIKKLGKRFNTEVGKSYKKRYGALSSFLDQDRDFFGGGGIWESRESDDRTYGNGSIMSYMDDGYGSYSRGRDYDSYGDEDEDGDSPFDKFMAKSSGSSRGKVKKSRRIERFNDEYDDSEDEDEEDDYVERRPLRQRPILNRRPENDEEDEFSPGEMKGAILKLAKAVSMVAKEQKETKQVACDAYDAIASLYEGIEDEATDEEEIIREELTPKDVIKSSDIDDILNASL